MPRLRVIIVSLRRPTMSNPKEGRADPFWEFGSFGCTGCHRKNLMNPNRLHELDGARLAFAQGGPDGVRLVHLTPCVTTRQENGINEVLWRPKRMPFRYDLAPILVRNDGACDFPSLKRMIRGVDRTTWEGRFSSKFRSRRTPLPATVATEIVRIFDKKRASAGRSEICRCYSEALPYPPPRIIPDRRAAYEGTIGKTRTSRAAGCRPSGARKKRRRAC